MAPGQELSDEMATALPASVLKGLQMPPSSTWSCIKRFRVPSRRGQKAYLPEAVAFCVRSMIEVPQRSWDQTGKPLVCGFGGGNGHVHASDGPEYTYHLTLSKDNDALASVHRRGVSVFRRDPAGHWVEQEKLLLDMSGWAGPGREAARQGDSSKGTIPHRLEWVGPGSSRLAMISHSIRGGLQPAVVTNKGSRISLWSVPPDSATRRRKRKREGDRITVFNPDRPNSGGMNPFWQIPQRSPPATLSVIPGPATDADENNLDSYVAICGYRDGMIRMWSLDSRKPSTSCLFRWSLLDSPCRPLDAGVRLFDSRSRRFVTQEIPVKGASLTRVTGENGAERLVLVILLRFSRQLRRSDAGGMFYMAEPEPTRMHNTRTTEQGVIWALDLGPNADAMDVEPSEEGKDEAKVVSMKLSEFCISSIRRMTCLHDSFGKTMQLAGVDRSNHAQKPWVVSAGEGPTRNLLVHNVVTGALLHELKGHTNTVHTLSIEGQWLASGSKDGTVRLWRWQLGECVRVLYAGEHRFPFFAHHPSSADELHEADSTSRALLQMSLAYRPPTIIAAVVGKEGDWVAGGGHELCVSGKTVIRVWSGNKRRRYE